MPVYNALIAGIGGQGVITLGTLLKKAALKAGIHVSGSERRGGAQREGQVASIIRYQWHVDGRQSDERREVCSPMLPAGSVQLLIGLEPLEAVRQARYLHEDSTVILNTYPLVPIPVKLGQAQYPSTETLIGLLKRVTDRIYAWNLTETSRREFGYSHALNAICLGIASRVANLPPSEAHLLAVLEEGGRPEDVRCFRLGAALADETNH